MSPAQRQAVYQLLEPYAEDGDDVVRTLLRLINRERALRGTVNRLQRQDSTRARRSGRGLVLLREERDFYRQEADSLRERIAQRDRFIGSL